MGKRSNFTFPQTPSPRCPRDGSYCSKIKSVQSVPLLIYFKVERAVMLWSEGRITIAAVREAQRSGLAIQLIKVPGARGQDTASDLTFVGAKWKEKTLTWLELLSRTVNIKKFEKIIALAQPFTSRNTSSDKLKAHSDNRPLVNPQDPRLNLRDADDSNDDVDGPADNSESAGEYVGTRKQYKARGTGMYPLVHPLWRSVVGPRSNIYPGSLSPTLTPPPSSNQQVIMRPLVTHSQPATIRRSQVPAQPHVAGGGGGLRVAVPSQGQAADVPRARNTAAPRAQVVATPQTQAAAAPRPQVVAASHAQTVAAAPSRAQVKA